MLFLFNDMQISGRVFCSLAFEDFECCTTYASAIYREDCEGRTANKNFKSSLPLVPLENWVWVESWQSARYLWHCSYVFIAKYSHLAWLAALLKHISNLHMIRSVMNSTNSPQSIKFHKMAVGPCFLAFFWPFWSWNFSSLRCYSEVGSFGNSFLPCCCLISVYSVY